MARIRLDYPTLAATGTMCNAAGKATLAERLAQRIQQLNAKWGICAGGGNAGDTGESVADTNGKSAKIDTKAKKKNNSDNDAFICERVDIAVECGSGRFKRRVTNNTSSATTDGPVTVQIDIPLSRTGRRGATKHSSSASEQQKDAVEILEDEVLHNGLFDLEQV